MVGKEYPHMMNAWVFLLIAGISIHGHEKGRQIVDIPIDSLSKFLKLELGSPRESYAYGYGILIEAELENLSDSVVSCTALKENFPFDISMVKSNGRELLAYGIRPLKTNHENELQSLIFKPREVKRFNMELTTYLTKHGKNETIPAGSYSVELGFSAINRTKTPHYKVLKSNPVKVNVE
jgi:hypothetical protein